MPLRLVMHGSSPAQQAGMQTLTVFVQQVHGSFKQSVAFTFGGGAGLQQTGAGAQQGAGAGAGQQGGAGAGSQQFLLKSPALAVEAQTRAAINAMATFRTNIRVFSR